MKIFIYTTIDQVLQSELYKQIPPGSELIFASTIPETEQKKIFNSAGIILGNPPPEWFQQAPSRLLFWQLDSAGFDQYQHLKLNIPVANMGDFFAPNCAETIVGGILAFYRGIHHLIRLQSIKKWKGKQIRPTLDLLGNKKALILGSGAIGLSVKKNTRRFRLQDKNYSQAKPNCRFSFI